MVAVTNLLQAGFESQQLPTAFQMLASVEAKEGIQAPSHQILQRYQFHKTVTGTIPVADLELLVR
jgi:hypothetical protein